jgi:hypothetical protein
MPKADYIFFVFYRCEITHTKPSDRDSGEHR